MRLAETPRPCKVCGVTYFSENGRIKHCSRLCADKTRGIKLSQVASLEERFWARVEKLGPDDCWTWKGARDTRGYGRISLNGGGAPTVVATRVAWELHNGRAASKPFMCHRCDNPSCVNPRHLFEGTVTDNNRDSLAKGRHYKASLTHCVNGHAFTPENTYRLRGSRYCRACNRAAVARRKQRLQAEGIVL